MLSRSYASHGPCDIRIGPYCYWLYTDRPKPDRPDPPELVAARSRLLALLDSAVRWEREGAWARGQRVRYLVEAHALPEAKRAATGCVASLQWWCDALQGYVAHVAGDFRRAERAYQAALSLMSEDRRCEWEDISELLTGGLRGHYRDLGCHERQDYERRLLWLADPLIVFPGNELWTEHLSRHVYAEFRENADGVDGRRWTTTMFRGLIRYGRPVWWERDAARRIGAASDEGIITHFTPHGRYYFPRIDNARDLAAVSEKAWSLRWRRAPATHAPGDDTGHLDRLDYELTYWPMGDSTGVIALVSLEDDSLVPGDSIRVLLAASTGPERGWVRRDTMVTAWRTALDLTLPTAPQLVSIEALAPKSNRAVRARFGIDPSVSTEVTVSDVLVVAANHADSLPRDRTEAMRRIDPSHTYRPGDELHLYWELFARDERPRAVQASLQLRKTRRSFLRRVAELTPFASQDMPISLSWPELTRPLRGLYPWAMSVTLPADISSGGYTFTLRIETAAGERFQRQREIEVVR